MTGAQSRHRDTASLGGNLKARGDGGTLTYNAASRSEVMVNRFRRCCRTDL